MKKFAPLAAALALAFPVSAQDEPSEAAPGPADIVNAAPQSEWVVIAPEDMLVMTLAPDVEGNERKVVMQLMPAPFSQGWVSNIRTLARAKWYDGISVNRVQDNYVVQWGDPGHDNPESGETETKPLPEGLKVMGEDGYVVPVESIFASEDEFAMPFLIAALAGGLEAEDPVGDILSRVGGEPLSLGDRYS